MSDAHQSEHQSFIRTPKQLIVAVAGFFLVIVIGIILLVTFVTNTPLAGAGSTENAEAVAARIQPVAADGFALKDANAPKVLQNGLAVYTATCAACHGTGAAGAPKIGDAGAWAARIKQGYDTLVQHAIQGIRAMPAKGGNPDLDDVEVARAMVYMANESGAKFKEPEAPAANATAANAPAAAAPAAAASAQPRLRRWHPGSPCFRYPAADCYGKHRRRRQSPVQLGLHRLPRHGHCRRTEVRRQGSLGATRRPGRQCPV
jgi:cytochrome c5